MKFSDSYKVKVLGLMALLLTIPMLGVLALAFAGKATVSDFIGIAEWAMGFLAANGVATIGGRALEGYAEKRDSPAPSPQNVAVEVSTARPPPIPSPIAPGGTS
jgi:hypothetical protein